MTDTLGEFGGFKTSSFYGKPLSDNVFTLRFHTPRIEQTYQSPSNKRSRSLSVDSRKAKKVKTSLFSGVGHGLKKPKPKKTETKKYVNTDTDKVLKSNKKRKQNEKASKENKPLNQTQKTPIKDVKSASAKKSSNKKNKDDSVEVNDDSFRYRFQVTPDHMKVPKVLPYSGFAAQSTSGSAKKGKKKLFTPEDPDDDFLKNLSSSKKIKLTNTKSSVQKTKKTTPKKLFQQETNNQVATPEKDMTPRSPKTRSRDSNSTPKSPKTRSSNADNTPSSPKNKSKDTNNTPKSPNTRSAKKVIYETIQLNETPSPTRTPKMSNLKPPVCKSTPNTISPRKSARLSTVIMNSPRASSNKKSSAKPSRASQSTDEPMLVDSPDADLCKKSSTPCSTPRTSRSSVNLSQGDSPKRTLSSKKKLFPKEDYNTTPGDYFEHDVTADSFNVFDILNDSLDGIEMLDSSCNGMKENLFSPKKSAKSFDGKSFVVERMNISADVWESSPEATNASAHYTFPKCKEVEPREELAVNTFPRSTRASRKCVRQLTPNPKMYGSNPRMYGSCKKTLKTAFELSQLQLSSPGVKICPVCAYKGDADDFDHQQVHSVVLKLKHYDFKNETVVATYHTDSGRIVQVTNEDKTWLQKANLVIEIADAELGFAESECPVLDKTQVYLYITKQTIVGLAVANPLTRANRLISSTLNHSVDYASEESYPALCGISRIWVLKTYRRKRIASRLLDAVRKNFLPNQRVPKDQLAFSVPTSDGKFLAAKYTERNDFLIFTELR